MGALIHCPVGQRAREAFACPLGSGEMLGMDDVQDASLAVAKQDTDTFMANEGAFERLNAFRSPPCHASTLQGVADERDFALQLVHVQLLEMHVQHAPKEHRCQHKQARSEDGK